MNVEREMTKGRATVNSMRMIGHRTEERGSYIVLAAFVIVVLMMTAALAVDISRKYQIEQKCQDVADAAAMAGAGMLPNVTMARASCTSYIQQSAGAWYIPRDSDVLIKISADNRSGTVGVMVRASWDPMIMPDWLVGSIIPNTVTRYAIAIMSLDTSRIRTTGPGDLDSSPNGPYAVFVGDTAVISAIEGNNIYIDGNMHFNDVVNISGNNDVQVNGTCEVKVGSLSSDIVTVVSPWEDMPSIDASKFHWDVVLDENNAVQKAYYNNPAGKDLLAINGQPVTNAKAYWNGTTWVITTTGFVTPGLAGQTANWGNGVDVNIIGAADVSFPNSSGGANPPDWIPHVGGQNYWAGSFQTTKKLTVKSQNSEISGLTKAYAVPGLDNPGLALNVGTTLNSSQAGFSDGGNAFDIYGLIYTPGNLSWTGAMNNYNAGDKGTAGNYDCRDNGFIKGSVVAGSLTSTGNNFKVYYDGTFAGPAPILDAVVLSPEIYSTPTVWLKQ